MAKTSHSNAESRASRNIVASLGADADVGVLPQNTTQCNARNGTTIEDEFEKKQKERMALWLLDQRLMH